MRYHEPMDDDGLGMDEVLVVLAVTDAYGVHRERVSVSLDRVDPGRVRWLPTGEVEVVVPLSTTLEAWLPALREALAKLGVEPVKEEQ